jgi:HAMP domain-containing protein
MKRTIQSRITLILSLALGTVFLTGALSLYNFSVISDDVKRILLRELEADRTAEEIRTQLSNLKQIEKIYLTPQGDFTDSVAVSDLDLTTPMRGILVKVQQYRQYILVEENFARIQTLETLAQKYLNLLVTRALQKDLHPSQVGDGLSETSSQMQDLMRQIIEASVLQLEGYRAEIEILISNAKRDMLLVLVIGLTGGFFLLIISPKRVTNPLNRFRSAISEIKDLKLDVKINVQGDDELAALGNEINAMVESLRVFDDMKQKRIQFEKNRLRVLANMSDQGVLLISIEGQILFMNGQMATILALDTEDYANKDYHHVALPEEIREMISEIISSKERIDSRMMILSCHSKDRDDAPRMIEVLVDVGLVRNYQGDVVNIFFTFEDISDPQGHSVFRRLSFVDPKVF